MRAASARASARRALTRLLLRAQGRGIIQGAASACVCFKHAHSESCGRLDARAHSTSRAFAAASDRSQHGEYARGQQGGHARRRPPRLQPRCPTPGQQPERALIYVVENNESPKPPRASAGRGAIPAGKARPSALQLPLSTGGQDFAANHGKGRKIRRDRPVGEQRERETPARAREMARKTRKGERASKQASKSARARESKREGEGDSEGDSEGGTG
jgi:hypothetical protein